MAKILYRRFSMDQRDPIGNGSMARYVTVEDLYAAAAKFATNCGCNIQTITGSAPGDVIVWYWSPEDDEDVKDHAPADR